MTNHAEARPALHRGNCLHTMLTTRNPITSLPVISHQLALQEWARSTKSHLLGTTEVLHEVKDPCPFALDLRMLASEPARHVGQNTTGSITGRLTDPTGAVIAGAKVTVRNLGTGEVRTLTTDASGDFTATLLLPGHYSVTAEHTGFKTAIQNDITLEVDQTVRCRSASRCRQRDTKS